MLCNNLCLSAVYVLARYIGEVKVSIGEIFLLTFGLMFGIIHIKLISTCVVGVLACIFLMFYQMGIDTLYLLFNGMGIISVREDK